MPYPDGQHKILVIDDEPVFRETMVAFLRQRNDLVYVAENGLDGLAAVAVYHPDLVLCDLKMPHMDGHQVIQCIAARFPHIPVMVISGQANMDDVTQALRSGAKDYLIKPIRNWSALAQAIDDCLDSAAEDRAYCELAAHLSRLHSDDLAATGLLHAMAPPAQQTLHHWQMSYHSSSPLLLPEFLELDGRLLLVVMELSFMGADAAFIGAMIKFLLHAPYRQYLQGESRMLDSPGSVLEYLNWNLYESGLHGNVNMAVILISEKDEQIRFANAGLTSPSWLQRASGMPLGMMRQAEYPTYQRVMSKPCTLQFRVDSGDELSIELQQAG